MTSKSFTEEVGDEIEKAFRGVSGVTVERNVTVGRAKDLATQKPKEKTVSNGNVAADQLRLFIERIERLEEEKKGMADDIRDVYSEAKSQGYDAKIMKLMIRLRRMETHDMQEMQAVAQTYASALGIQYELGL